MKTRKDQQIDRFIVLASKLLSNEVIDQQLLDKVEKEIDLVLAEVKTPHRFFKRLMK